MEIGVPENSVKMVDVFEDFVVVVGVLEDFVLVRTEIPYSFVFGPMQSQLSPHPLPQPLPLSKRGRPTSVYTRDNIASLT